MKRSVTGANEMLVHIFRDLVACSVLPQIRQERTG